MSVTNKKEVVTVSQVHDACKELFVNCDDGYGKTYALAVLQHNMEGRVLSCQISYILMNCGSWKGELARSTKNVLRTWQKQNKY